jgi:hypothetical protein
MEKLVQQEVMEALVQQEAPVQQEVMELQEL